MIRSLYVNFNQYRIILTKMSFQQSLTSKYFRWGGGGGGGGKMSYGRHMEVLSKYDATLTNNVADALPYFDLVHLFVFLVRILCTLFSSFF